MGQVVIISGQGRIEVDALVEQAALAAWVAYCTPDGYDAADYADGPEQDPVAIARQGWIEWPDCCTHIGAEGFRRIARAVLIDLGVIPKP